MNIRHVALGLLVMFALVLGVAAWEGATAAPRAKRRALLVRDRLANDIGVYEWRGRDGTIRQAGPYVAWFDLQGIYSGVPNLVYDAEDCTGQSYIPQDSNSIMPLGTTSESFIYYPVEPPSNVLIVSGLGGGGECGSLPNGPREIWVSKAQHLETAHFIPPFTIVP